MELLDQIRMLRDNPVSSLDTDETFGVGDLSPDMAAQALAQNEVMDLLAAASDEEVRAAYRRTSGQPGDFETDTLAAECERRHINL